MKDYRDNFEQKLQMTGKIINYQTKNNLTAFTNCIQSSSVMIFIGGLGDNLLSTPFTSNLNDFCTQRNIKLYIPLLKSMPNYKTFLIDNDVEQIHILISIIKSSDIIILGHSTGCQISMLYLKKYGTQKLKQVILQAPVSDVQYQESINLNLKLNILQAKNTKFYQYYGNIWLTQRFLSLNQRFNTQDLFSTHLQDSNFQNWKEYKIPIISIISGCDKYTVKSNQYKLKLGSQTFVIKGASHNMAEKSSRQQFFTILSKKI